MPNYPKILDRKIKYPSAPSGEAHIGKYIPPFEVNETGFGFKGVLVEDFKSGKIECSICGNWYEQISDSHLKKHKVTNAEYKKRFGLLTSTALKSKKMRLRQSEVMIKLRKENKNNRLMFKRGNSYAGNRKDKLKAEESKNKFGVCDLQVMERIEELRQELGKTPTLIDLKNRYGSGMMTLLFMRYGGYLALLRSMGITPNFSNYNPKYSREYFIEKALSNEPRIRIFTTNEGRAFYRFFKGGIKELRVEVNNIKQDGI